MILWYTLLILLIASLFALVGSYETVKREYPREKVILPQTMSRAEQHRIVNELLREEKKYAHRRF
jgi:hypothetical protein